MKNIKKIMALLLALTLCLALTACSGGNDAPAASGEPSETADSGANTEGGKTVDDIKNAGKLVVATSPDFPPFEYLEGDKVVGIEVEILQKIADGLGVELVIEQMDFDSVLPGIQASKFDVGMSGITITEARQKNADFTVPYFLASQAIVVKADSPIKSKADLEGKKISVQTGTTAEEYCMGEGYDVQAYQANNDANQALLDGRVDAWVVDNEVAIDISAKNNGATIVLDEAMTSEPYGFAFQKGSTSLVEEINKMLNGWIADGTIQGIFDKYEVPYVSPAK